MLANTHPNFQDTIRRLATVAKLTPDAVYTLWQKYSKQCSNSDQSALVGEFIEWYQKDLGGDRVALHNADRGVL